MSKQNDMYSLSLKYSNLAHNMLLWIELLNIPK